jgi:hypothetical protein
MLVLSSKQGFGDFDFDFVFYPKLEPRREVYNLAENMHCMLSWGHTIRKERRYAVPPDPSSPAENQGHASEEHPDPATFAQRLFGHLAEVHGTDADLYLAKAIAELFDLSPIARDHVSDLFFVELTEELSGRGKKDAVRAVLKVQTFWDQEA